MKVVGLGISGCEWCNHVQRNNNVSCEKCNKTTEDILIEESAKKERTMRQRLHMVTPIETKQKRGLDFLKWNF
jgi:hypothetical protein